MAQQSSIHPAALSTPRKPNRAGARSGSLAIPGDGNDAELAVHGRTVRLTNLAKPFWPELRITKRDLLQYYLDVSKFLLPHLENRAMVMKRYPNGAAGEFFFQKRAPEPRPDWVPICTILHASGNRIGFPVVSNLETLLWVVNLGCIDLNQWYARCDDVDRPDYFHFDLDPTPGGTFEQVREAALVIRDALAKWKMPTYAKTTGSRGIHVYIPIRRGPTQKQVWTCAKEMSRQVVAAHPGLLTAEYRVNKRPEKRVLVDYNQNAWGRTLASVYSVRPKPRATVSAPVTWEEIEKGIRLEDFRLDNMPARLRKVGDLFRPLLLARGRVNLEPFL